MDEPSPLYRHVSVINVPPDRALVVHSLYPLLLAHGPVRNCSLETHGPHLNFSCSSPGVVYSLGPFRRVTTAGFLHAACVAVGAVEDQFSVVGLIGLCKIYMVMKTTWTLI